MVEVKPFRGIMYNTQDLRKKITEPYDKITMEMRERYYGIDEYNFIRLNLPKDKDPYTSSKNTLKRWLDEGILKKSEKQNFYHYIQKFELNGKVYERNGFFAVVKLERYESKNILPHERTFSGPKEDRMKMLRSTNVDLEPVFFLYDDPELQIMKIFRNSNEQKIAEVIDDNGVMHILLSAYSPEIEHFFRDRKLVIADGHHRYETALAYAQEMNRVNGTGYIMAVLVNRYDPGLIILPSHRIIDTTDVKPEELLQEIKKYFEISEVKRESIKGFINEELIFVFENQAYSLKLKKEFINDLSISERLNVSILNKYIISNILNLESKENIKYARWPEEVLPLIDEGKAKFAFLVKPVTPSKVWEVAVKGEIMPQKSTDFYPKLISGLEMFDLKDEV